MSFRDDGHIATTVRLMEQLKTDLITGVSRFHRSIFQGAEKKAVDSLSQIMVTCYLLGKKLGLTYYRTDCLLQQRVRQFLKEDKEEEPLKDDLLELLQYLESKDK